MAGISLAATIHYPQYDRHLETSIVAESESYFRELLHNDLDVIHFVKSDYGVINERLARFFGIDSMKGDKFRRVNVPDGVAVRRYIDTGVDAHNDFKWYSNITSETRHLDPEKHSRNGSWIARFKCW